MKYKVTYSYIEFYAPDCEWLPEKTVSFITDNIRDYNDLCDDMETRITFKTYEVIE